MWFSLMAYVHGGKALETEYIDEYNICGVLSDFFLTLRGNVYQRNLINILFRLVAKVYVSLKVLIPINWLINPRIFM